MIESRVLSSFKELRDFCGIVVRYLVKRIEARSDGYRHVRSAEIIDRFKFIFEVEDDICKVEPFEDDVKDCHVDENQENDDEDKLAEDLTSQVHLIPNDSAALELRLE